MKQQGIMHQNLISILRIPELHEVKYVRDGLFIGSCVTMVILEEKLKEAIKIRPSEILVDYIINIIVSIVNSATETKSFVALLEMLQWYAGPQIKNLAVSCSNSQ